MPPSKHSGSSRSAHKDSDQIPSNQNYTLGDYSFRIERSSVPGSTNDKIEAICTRNGQTARKSIQVPSSTQVTGWHVEANDETADVYVDITARNTDVKNPIPITASKPSANESGFSGGYVAYQYTDTRYGRNIIYSQSFYSKEKKVCIIATGNDTTGKTFYAVSGSRFTLWFVHKAIENGTPSYGSGEDINTNLYDAETGLYYLSIAALGRSGVDSLSTPLFNTLREGLDYVYSGMGYQNSSKLIARFEIDLEDAGGVGPESDWTDPGDYDPDWEEGDPAHTLYVTVTGALSGRHNDPIEDPSYSYIPADKDTVKDYGCGGDGGHGGGGGAGASTVVIYKFATNQANSKEVTALARRHGYGSGGGKGGKGGDGCILVYY